MSSYSITPEGKVNLCHDIPLKPSYSDVWSFANSTERINYFNSKVLYSYTDYTFIKKDSAIVVDENVDNLRYCNYLFYNSYNNGSIANSRTYFCFILGMDYINENATKVYFTTDVWTTYCFDIVGNKCMISREHTPNDTFGNYVLDEGLNVGDYVQEGSEQFFQFVEESKYYIIINTTAVPETKSSGATSGVKKFAGMTIHDKNTNGGKLCYFPINSDSFTTDITNVIAFINCLNEQDGIDNIISIYIIPYGSLNDPEQELFPIPFINENFLTEETEYPHRFQYYEVTNNLNSGYKQNFIFARKTYSSYTPKNNKCYIYPYNYLQVSDMQGTTVNYKFENFTSSNVTFEFHFTGGVQNGSGILIPLNYMNKSQDYEDGIDCPKFPTVSWSSDSYVAWMVNQGLGVKVNFGIDAYNALLTQASSIFSSANSMKMDITKFDLLDAALAKKGLEVPKTTKISAASSDVLDQINTGTSAASSLLGTLGSGSLKAILQDAQAKMLPNEAHKGNGDIMWTVSRVGYSMRQLRGKDEFIKKIDNYFTMYGYRVDIIDTPLKYYRTYFDYKETANANFTGNVPNEDLNLLNTIFDKGVRIWHYGDGRSMYNYDVTNSIA